MEKLPVSVSISDPNGHNFTIFDKETKLPATKTVTLGTIADDQRTLRFNVIETLDSQETNLGLYEYVNLA